MKKNKIQFCLLTSIFTLQFISFTFAMQDADKDQNRLIARAPAAAGLPLLLLLPDAQPAHIPAVLPLPGAGEAPVVKAALPLPVESPAIAVAVPVHGLPVKQPQVLKTEPIVLRLVSRLQELSKQQAAVSAKNKTTKITAEEYELCGRAELTCDRIREEFEEMSNAKRIEFQEIIQKMVDKSLFEHMLSVSAIFVRDE